MSPNSLLALNTIVSLLERAAHLGQLIQIAREEGRDVSDAELDVLAQADTDARARLQATIERKRLKLDHDPNA